MRRWHWMPSSSLLLAVTLNGSTPLKATQIYIHWSLPLCTMLPTLLARMQQSALHCIYLPVQHPRLPTSCRTDQPPSASHSDRSVPMSKHTVSPKMTSCPPVVCSPPLRVQRGHSYWIQNNSKHKRQHGLWTPGPSEGNIGVETISIAVCFPLHRCTIRNNFNQAVEEWVHLTFLCGEGNPFEQKARFTSTSTFPNRDV